MYSILIVDDEMVILEGLREVIEQARLPFQEIQTVASAGAALDLFRKKPFDVVLTDISMPEMNGLEMVARIREIWPDTAVLFLTGYQYFDYVKKALQLGGIDYLVKPISDETLIDTLTGVIRKLDDQWYRRFYETEVQKYMDRTLESRQWALLERWLNRKEDIDTAGLQEDFTGLQLSLNAGRSVQAVLVCYDQLPGEGRTGQAEEAEIEKVHRWLLNILQDIFYGTRYVAGTLYRKRFSVYLLQRDGHSGSDDNGVKKMFQEMQSYLLQKTDTVISVEILKEADWNGIPAIIRQRIREYRENGAGGGLILEGEEMRADDSDGAQQSEKNERIAQEGNGISPFVRRVQSYILNNPGADLSLGALSEQFKINPSYLSRVFHKEVRIPLSVFILEVRIEEAKRLLLHTDQKVYEIAAAVGFDTSGYFTKVFSKYTGISPKEYRMR